MSVLFDMNSNKKFFVLFFILSLKVSELLDVNSERMCVVLFGRKPLKVPELFDMNSKIKGLPALIKPF